MISHKSVGVRPNFSLFRGKQTMIELEIINACLAPAITKDALKLATGIDCICIAKLFGKEIARTQVSQGSFDPVWHEKFPKSLHELITKEVVHNRPFYLESIDIEVHEISKKDGEKQVKLFETRVPISNIGLFKSYKLLKCTGSNSENKDFLDESRIFVRITRVSNPVYDKVEDFKFQQLHAVCPIHSPLYRHLYLDFSWSPNAFTYSSGLPGPTRGEFVVDRYYSVEWRVASGTNIFGDKLSVACTGQLIITDLRIIFVPYEIHAPALTWGAERVLLKDPAHFEDFECTLTASEILAVQRYTFQLPLSGLKDCRSYAQGGSSGSVPIIPSMQSIAAGTNLLGGLIETAPTATTSAAWVLSLDGVDGSSTEFIIKKNHGHRSQRRHVLGFDQLHASMIRSSQNKLDSVLFRSGLDTDDIDPQVWCERVVDYVIWELKLDMSWIRWAKGLKRTCRQQFTSQVSKAWVKKALSPIDLDTDFQRLRVQDMDWRLSDLNNNYLMCPTYPSVLVFPGALQEEEVMAAAAERSIGRLPALVWLHPDTKAPLCRAAQPLSGMSGNTIEHDKKMCLAIKNSCPTGLPLRIADARPKLNANANAMQGKGFENVSFLGGPSVASIVFMDIDNIHVIRHSLAKLRESLYSGGNNAVSDAGAGANSPAAADGSTVHASKWTSHIGSILRGAASVADSLMIGHPVLVHCSDGWDRTAQLTSLSQLMIDPYYRTIEGFLTLMQKEWCSFGHKFEDRLGTRRSHHKEVSPVCLQFLDCVWQLQRQFPTAFEYSGQFVTFISQCMYSGLFLNFRRNSERDRSQLMRNVGPFEDMQNDDFDFSTLSGYTNLLLRTSNQAALMLNASYVPPKPSQKNVHFLRPCYGLHDLELWKDGICGLNCNVHASANLAAPSVTLSEAATIHNDLHNRYLGYIELHMNHLPAHVQTKLDLIKCSDYPGYTPDLLTLSSSIACSSNSGTANNTTTENVATEAGQLVHEHEARNSEDYHTPATAEITSLSNQETRLLRSLYPHSIVLNPSSNVSRRLKSHWRHEDYDASFHDVLDGYKAEEACRRIQLWVKSVFVARNALKILKSYIEEMGLKPPSSEVTIVSSLDADGWVIKRKAYLRQALSDGSPKSYFKLFYILSASQIRTRYREQAQLQASRAAFMRSIVDDAVEQAMIYCIRNDNYQIAYAYRRSATVTDGDQISNLSGMLLNNSRTSTDLRDNKKSLSSRIFGFTGTNKESSPASSTSNASSSASMLASEQRSGKYNNVAGNRGSAKLDSHRSHSPKPSSLMGRLMGGK